jgi:hypothetical protein
MSTSFTNILELVLLPLLLVSRTIAVVALWDVSQDFESWQGCHHIWCCVKCNLKCLNWTWWLLTTTTSSTSNNNLKRWKLMSPDHASYFSSSTEMRLKYCRGLTHRERSGCVDVVVCFLFYVVEPTTREQDWQIGGTCILLIAWELDWQLIDFYEVLAGYLQLVAIIKRRSQLKHTQNLIFTQYYLIYWTCKFHGGSIVVYLTLEVLKQTGI